MGLYEDNLRKLRGKTQEEPQKRKEVRGDVYASNLEALNKRTESQSFGGKYGSNDEGLITNQNPAFDQTIKDRERRKAIVASFENLKVPQKQNSEKEGQDEITAPSQDSSDLADNHKQIATSSRSSEPLPGTPEWLAWWQEKQKQDQKTQELLTGNLGAEKNLADEKIWESRQQAAYSRMTQDERDLLEELWQTNEAVKQGSGFARKAELEQSLARKGYDVTELLRYYTMQKNNGKAIDQDQKWAEQADEHGVRQSLLSIPAAWIGTIPGALDLAGQRLERTLSGSDAPLETNTEGQELLRFAETTREQVGGNLQEWADKKYGENSWQGQALNLAYQSVMGGVDSAAAMLTGPAAPLLLGTQAGTSAVRGAIEEGAGTDEAILFGVTAGALESFFEKYSIGNLKHFKEVKVKDAKDFFENLFKTTFVNASEEAATQFGDDLAEYALMGDASQLSQAWQTAYIEAVRAGASPEEAEKQASGQAALWVLKNMGTAAAGGALMGGMFGLGRNSLALYNASQAQSPQANYARVVEENTRAEQGQVQSPAGETAAPAAREAQAAAGTGKAVEKAAAGEKLTDSELKMFAPDGKHEENRARTAWALELESLPETGIGTRNAILQAAANRGPENEAQGLPRAEQPEAQAAAPAQATAPAQTAQGTGVTQTEAAPQNGEPLVGSPEWLAREKAKQTESKVTAAAKKARRGEHLSRTELDLLTNPNNRQTAQAVLGEELPKGAKEAREYLRGMEGRQNTAVDDDPDTHTPEQMRAIEEYKASVDMDLVEYYKAVSRGEKRPSYTVGTVEGRAAKAIRDMTGVEAQGSSVVMNRNSVEHIRVRHGEGGQADSTMADPEDVGRVNYVLQNFDEAYLATDTSKTYRNADRSKASKIVFAKKIDGTYVVVEAVPDNQSGKVYIVTQYLAMGEPDKTKWGEPWQAPPISLQLGGNEPGSYVRNAAASSSPTQRVAENEDSVKEEMPDMGRADSYQEDLGETDQYGRRRVSAETREQVRKIGARFRRNVRFEELGPGENGYFDRSTGEIVLSTYLKPGKGAVSVLVHELTHSAELARTYQAIKDFVRENETAKKWLREKGFDSLEQYEDFLRDEYRRQGKDADPEAEAVAFFVEEKLFQNEQSLKELESGHRGLVREMLDLVRTALGQLTGNPSEAVELRRVERMLEKALKETEGQMGQSQAEGSESRQYSIDKYWERSIDKWDGEDHRGYFKLGTVSKVLKNIGVAEGPIYFDESKAVKALAEHKEISRETLKGIPAMLENPMVVAASYDNSIVAMGELYGKNGRPVVVAIKLDATKRGTSISGVSKVRSIGERRDVHLDKLLSDDAILYLNPNKNETGAWFQALGRSTPVGGTKFGLIQTIAQAQEKNNRFRENNGNPNAEKRQFDLDLSEDIRRRKEERDQKTRQAVEEMDQAVRAGLRQKAAPQNGEPLVGSPQWLAQSQDKEQTRAAIAREKNKAFSIQTDQQGEYVRVDTDQDLFEGKDPKEWAKIARQYIQAKFQGTVLPVGSESSAYVSGDAKAEYAHPANRRMDQNARNAKMRAATELDNLLRTAKEPTHVPDDGRHPEATGGWTHYTVRFQVGDKMFTGVVDIMNTSNGRRFYDITKIKELPLSTEPSFEARTAVLGEPGGPARESGLASASEAAASGRPSYDPTVAESGENVNREAEAPDMGRADSYQEDLGETDQYGRRRVSAETREQVRKIGARFRRNVRFEELGPGENGYFDRSTGEIVLSTYLKPGKGAVSVLVHELTHSAELARTYQAIKDFVRENETAKKWLREKGFDSLEQYEDFLQDEYRRQGKDADPEAEAVAFFVEEKLFQNEQSLKELESGHRGLVREMLDLVRTALGQLTGRTSEENELRRVERMLEKALKETEGQVGQSQADGSESRRYNVTLGMSEEQRGRELKDAQITMPLVDQAKYDETVKELNGDKIQRSAVVYAKALGKKFKIFRGFENPGMEIEFEFTGTGVQESVNKQRDKRNLDEKRNDIGLRQLHKLFSCFEQVVQGAVPVEIHSDRYKDTHREDKELKQTYVLLGAYQEKNPATGALDTVPVLFQIKEFKTTNKANKLYVTVTAKKTGTEGHSVSTAEDNPGGSHAASVPVNSTVAEKARGVKEEQATCAVKNLVQSLDPTDGWMLKYFPDSWLSEAQKQGKRAALEDDAKKLRKLEEDTRRRQKEREEKRRARDNESGGQKTRQFDLDLSEEIRRRKEERERKARQAVEEMDQAVRDGLRQKAASQNGEPLVGSPQWLARKKQSRPKER